MPRLLMSLLLLCGVLSNLAAADVRAAEPNFLLIVADDLCWRDLGFTGNEDVKTPRLDRLAAEGMQLTGMFTPATTCSPSRHALYTGLFPIRSGAYPNHTRAYDGTKSVFTHLAAHGYRTGLQGKTHVGPRASFPYERVGGRRGADNFAATREFVTRDADQPWLLVYASHDPHSPWTRGPKKQYDPDALTMPPYLHDNADTRQRLAGYYAEISKLDMQVGELLDLLDETLQTEDTLVIFVSEQGSSFPYGGKWSLYDNGIRAATIARWPGRIAAGSTSDALVQYVDVAPTLLDAAGIEPPSIDVGCPDADGGTGFDGRSILKVLTGETDEFRDVVFSQQTTVGIHGYEEPYPMRAARGKRFKYIRNLAPENTYSINGIQKHAILKTWQADATDGSPLAARIEWLFRRPAEELYDLKTDPYEVRNVADDSQFADVKARLSERLDAWMAQQGDQGMVTELAAPSRQ